jgi:hypothetical protein
MLLLQEERGYKVRISAFINVHIEIPGVQTPSGATCTADVEGRKNHPSRDAFVP